MISFADCYLGCCNTPALDDSCTDQERNQAKAILKRKGWTYRTGAPALGVTHPHLSQVLNGHRTSARILRDIERLPYAARKTARQKQEANA